MVDPAGSIDLNDIDAINEFDSGGMVEALTGLPEQMIKARQLALEVELPEDFLSKAGNIRNIVVAGMGGSAIGGDLLRVYCLQKLGVAVSVIRDYKAPCFVDKHSMVFATSYSGNTEETLSFYEEAKERGAAIVNITSGGKLEEMAVRDGLPVISIPAGLAPRAATGYLFLPTVLILEQMGLLQEIHHEVDELVDCLKEMRSKLKPDSPVEKNPAKKLALSFKNHIPLVWGASSTTEVVAQRWKGQINENAKAPAFWNVFPELNHNEIVGFEVPEKALSRLWIVFLQDKYDHPRVKKRMDITRAVVEKSVGGVSDVHSVGEGLLARMYSLIYTGDFASVYLAMLYGINPGPVKAIDYLKKELAKQKKPPQ